MSTSVHRGRQRLQRENTRREILAAADRLLRERPYRELSVDLIMAQTDLTRTAFYRHFDDIPSLVLRLLEDVGHELYAIAQRWRDEGFEDLTGATGRGLEGIVAFMVRHGPLVRAVADASVTDELIERGYSQFRDAFTELITEALERLAERGELDVPHPRSMAVALNLMNEVYLLDQFGQEPLGDPELALRTLETIWVRVLERR